MTPPLFLVAAADLVAGPVVIGGDEGRHAASVRRIRSGEHVMVGDGAGRIGVGPVAAVGRDRIEVDVASITYQPRPELRFVVVQALARGGRDEAAVEAMTEVGVDMVVGWSAARSVARWTERTADRWRATARAATKQSRRAWLPEILGPASTPEVCERLNRAAAAIVLDATGEQSLARVELPERGEVVIMVGPEGGFEPAELTAFQQAGAAATRLGELVLRSSTAGVAALAVLSAGKRWS